MEKAKIIIKNNKSVIDFPCKKFKQYLLCRYDRDGDGEISLEEAQAIKNITLIHYQLKVLSVITIGSLSGIEYFENLLVLDCPFNKIEGVLDVSMNNRLKYLRCDGNKITKLTMGEHPALTNLYCSNNLIEDLNMSLVPGLKMLDCSVNLLNELDVSANPKLAYLKCSSNRIKSIDVSMCMDLMCLDYQDNINHTQMKSLAIQNFEIKNIFPHSDKMCQVIEGRVYMHKP